MTYHVCDDCDVMRMIRNCTQEKEFQWNNNGSSVDVDPFDRDAV